MNIKNIIRNTILGAFTLTTYTLNAQTPVELHITHQLNGGNFAFNTTTQNDLGNDFNVSRLEYYISKISIKHDGGTITPVPNHYILANANQNVTDALGSFNVTNVEGILLHIGVDAPINHADPTLQPPSHPLAPKSPSMHWGWASGYRFVAMEGQSGTSLNQNYQIHALGDQHYIETTVPVTGVMKNGTLVIPLNADYAKALKGINVSSGLIAHGDGLDEAKLLANFQSDVFSAGNPVGVNTVNNSMVAIKAYPSPSTNGLVTIRTEGISTEATIKVLDVTGRNVANLIKPKNKEQVVLQLNSGFYFVQLHSNEVKSQTIKIQVL